MVRPEYPFFIVIDDGAFPFVNRPDGTRVSVPLDTYIAIRDLAKEFDTRIPVCFTMKYLDVHKVTNEAEPLEYAKELFDFLNDNSKYIEIGYHGLTHSFEGHVGEFFCLDTNTKVPEEIQAEHFRKSAEIFKSIGWSFPELFVPPSHGWEQGVTDRIAANFGTRYIVSKGAISYKGINYKWNDSEHIGFCRREDIGIYSYDIRLNQNHFKNARRHIIPRSRINNFRLRRRFSNTVCHSYMTHIGNFLPDNLDIWKKIFSHAKNKPQVSLSKTNLEAADIYNKETNRQYEIFLKSRFSVGLEPYVDSLRNNINHAPKKILDIGCGPGQFLFAANDVFKGGQMLGVDINPYYIKKAISYAEEKKIKDCEFKCCSVYDLENIGSDNKFDLIMCNSTIQYLDQERAFSLFSKLLSSDGTILMLWNHAIGYYIKRLIREAALLNIWGVYYCLSVLIVSPLKLLLFGKYSHDNFVSFRKLNQISSKYGLHLQLIETPQAFDYKEIFLLFPYVFSCKISYRKR